MRLFLLAALAVALLAVPAHAASDRTHVFLAESGCAMAHCDQGETDASNTVPPAAATTLWHDTTVTGSVMGLGCSSNLTVAVCSLNQGLVKRTTLRAYRADGTVAWSSQVLNGSAVASAPMVGPDGSTIAADNKTLLRLSPAGQVVWQTVTAGGTPISPNLTDDGTIVLATAGGPVSTYDPDTGRLLASVKLTDTITIGGQPTTGYFDTDNTPAVQGQRVYVSTTFRDSTGKRQNGYGRLYALDVTPASVTPAWHFDFRGPSGASPDVLTVDGSPVVYFDGTGLTPGAASSAPDFVAVRDAGDHPELAWNHPLPAGVAASGAVDPRGGIWTWGTYTTLMVRLDLRSGTVLQTIDMDQVVGQPGVHVPGGPMTITGPPDRPVMLVPGTQMLGQSSYLVALDLVSGSADWTVRYDEGKGFFAGVSYGQYPVVKRPDGQPVVVMTSYGNGVWGIG